MIFFTGNALKKSNNPIINKKFKEQKHKQFRAGSVLMAKFGIIFLNIEILLNKVNYFHLRCSHKYRVLNNDFDIG